MTSVPSRCRKFSNFCTVFFHRDFIASKAYLHKDIHIDPQEHKQEDGKPATFWHITTKETSYTKKVGKNRFEKVTERLYNSSRSERIEWVRKIIENHDHDSIRMFYSQDSEKHAPVRLFLWAYEKDFVVILQKLGKSSSFLVTSFYIDYPDKRKEFEQKFRRYENGHLQGEAWF